MSGRDVSPGMLGAVIEAYTLRAKATPSILRVRMKRIVDGYEYDNVLLTPDQFIVVMRYVENEGVAAQAG